MKKISKNASTKKWLGVSLFVIFVNGLFVSQAYSARAVYGDEEVIRKIVDVELESAKGEHLFLGYKITRTWLLLPLYIVDDGYVLGIDGEKNAYYEMPQKEKLKNLQDQELLPQPLPEYHLSLLDYLFGYSLWLIVLALIIYIASEYYKYVKKGRLLLREWKEMFTDEKWVTLQYAPLWAYFAVAGADGKVDEMEHGAFKAKLNNWMTFEGKLVQSVLFSLKADYKHLSKAFVKDTRGVTVGLTEVADLLDEVSIEESSNFKTAMLQISFEVAKASGGGILGLGDKVSAEEKEAIALLALLIRYDVN